MDKKNLKLIYFVQYFYPEKTSGRNLVLDLIEGFAKNGWDVHVYTPTPTRGVTKEVRQKYKKIKIEKKYDGHLTIHRMTLYREGNKIIPRAIRYTLFSFQCLWYGLTTDADVVFSGSGPPTQGIVGGIISKFTRKKFVYNLQDIFPDSLVNANICSKKSFIYRIGRVIENFTYKNSDLIITVSEDMNDNIAAKGAEMNKVKVIRNWIDCDKVKPVLKENNKLYDELGIDKNKFIITYAGNIGTAQGIDNVIRAAELLKNNSHIQFILFGEGSEKDNINAMVKNMNLNNVIIYPLLEEDRICEVYSLGDLSIVPCKKGVGNAGMPSKTWLIMSAGTGVLGFFDKDTEFEKILLSSRAGINVEANDFIKLAKTIEQLSIDSNQVELMGRRARLYIEQNVSKDHAVGEYIKRIESILS